MYLNYSEPQLAREGCILCLRSDHERTMDDTQREVVISQAKELFGERISYRDMIADGNILPERRDAALSAQFDAFKQAELVITDRLHGMVFCAITGTPCIVLNSKSHKVRGCYEWIKHLAYIRTCDDVAQIPDAFRNMPKGSFSYDNSSLQPYFTDLINDLKKGKQAHG